MAQAPMVYWDDISAEQRADTRLCPIWGVAVQHRGCGGAVQWPDGQGWHRCAARALQAYRLCRKHAVRAGLVAPTPVLGAYPHGLDSATGNAIRRTRVQTVAEFRALTDLDIRGLRNVGVTAASKIRTVRDTWSDDDLVSAFGFASPPRAGYCNWVGEFVPEIGG